MLRKKSAAEIAADKVAISRLLRIYRIAFGVPGFLLVLMAAFWLGYVMGYFDGWNQRPHILERNN